MQTSTSRGPPPPAISEPRQPHSSPPSRARCGRRPPRTPPALDGKRRPDTGLSFRGYSNRPGSPVYVINAPESGRLSGPEGHVAEGAGEGAGVSPAGEVTAVSPVEGKAPHFPHVPSMECSGRKASLEYFWRSVKSCVLSAEGTTTNQSIGCL